MRQCRTLVAIATVILTATACGSQASPSPSSGVAGETASPASAPGSAAASTSSDALLVRTIDGLPGAVVQIETTGAFRDPLEGREDVTGRGSGFIIDTVGIVVTNNHVVTGAEKVTIWVGAGRSEHQAEVLGASECSDLAIVRIDGGPFPYLDWYEGDINPGLEIYAAGFPLGDPEFTLSRGIVSRAHGVIDEDWASVSNSIEHDANINPGSSGGPVVTSDAQIVAVDYAGDPDTRQSFAISRAEALPILADLEAGQDVASLGINGFAVGPDDFYGTHQGIWVSSVKPDSAADQAGILPGDSITKVGGKTLAAKGTMNEYCEVIRGHKAGDKLAFSVYREDSRETLAGDLNGTALKPGFAFATALGDGPPLDPTPLNFDEVTFEPGGLSFETPGSWEDYVDQPWSFGGADVGTGRIVSTDVKAFKGGWKTPGLFVAASESVGASKTIDNILDADLSQFRKSCDYIRREPFRRGLYAGKYDLWQSCEGSDTRFLTIAAAPKDGSHTVYLQFQAVTNTDLAVLDRVLATLTVANSGS